MEHIRRIAVNPGPGTGSQWLLRLAIPIEPARWQGQERQDAWRFPDGKNGEDDLSAKERSSFYSRYGRLFGKRLPIIPYFLHQISHFSGAKLTQTPCLHLRMTVFYCNGCLLKREHWRQEQLLSYLSVQHCRGENICGLQGQRHHALDRGEIVG